MSRYPREGDAEARAAARMAGSARPGAAADSDAPMYARDLSAPDGICRSEVWRALAAQIFRAERVDFVGLMPRGLIEALRETGTEAAGARLPPIRYFTPTPESILAGHEQSTRTRLANRWQVGLRGLRNLVKELGDRPSAEYHRFVFGLSSIFVDCILVVHGRSQNTQVYFLSELPKFGAGPGANPIMLLNVREGRTELAGYLQQVMADAGVVRLREVTCLPAAAPAAEPPGTPAEPFIPPLAIGKFTADGGGSGTGTLLRPVATVVVRCHTPAGVELLLKIRTPFTDNDDFGRVSLLTSRLQESDIASAIGCPISPGTEEDGAALENLWLAAGSPVPFLVPDRAFVLAAQRELFVTCGLEVSEERLILRGFQSVPREDSNNQLGFAVFTIDLVRSQEFDEVRCALAANPEGLLRVPLTELYEGSHELNRLLRARRDWLQQACFETM